MTAAIEYISAGVIIFLILGVTGQYATNMVYDRVNTIERKSGTGRADRIIDLLLLSPGAPPDWGDSLDDPESMGLAPDNAIKLYQLDKAKVRRLSSNSTSYIPAYRVRDLLGLSGYYYLSIEVYPLFNISITKLTDEKFTVGVKNQWKVPVSNINVTSAYADIATVNDTIIQLFLDQALPGTFEAANVTNTLGSCTLNFPGAGSRTTLLILASRFDVRSMSTWPVLSPDVVGFIESSMGTSSVYEVEVVHRNVEIDGLNYIVKLKLWS